MELDAIASFEDFLRLEAGIKGNEDLLRLLRANRLARRKAKPCCDEMRDVPYRRSSLFGRAWRCLVCRKLRPFLMGSVFEESGLHPLTVLKVAYTYLVCQMNCKSIRAAMRTAPTTEALTHCLQLCRNVISKDLARELRWGMMGGWGQVVAVCEIPLERISDESEGDAREPLWVLSFYDLQYKIGTVLSIDDGTQASIIPKIVDYVEQGSLVVLNQPQTYAGLVSKGFTFDSLDADVCTLGRARTNAIRAYFSGLQAYLSRRGPHSPSSISSYLGEFMWMEGHRDDVWVSFLQALRRQYFC